MIAVMALIGAGMLCGAAVFSYFGTYWYLYWQEKSGKGNDD